MAPRNIIFDLGGVILNLDFARTADAFRALGAGRFDALWTATRQSPLFDAFETGQISAAAFRDGLRQALDLRCDDAALDDAWNGMILDMPADRVAFVRDLKGRFRTFLLSNTNAIHLARLRALGEDIDACFERAYYSHLLGHRKPTPQAFQAILDGQGLSAGETLFVDDMLANVEAARRIGLTAVRIDPTQPLAPQMNPHLE
jgi:putative hydrolase of the HAD superfamily